MASSAKVFFVFQPVIPFNVFTSRRTLASRYFEERLFYATEIEKIVFYSMSYVFFLPHLTTYHVVKLESLDLDSCEEKRNSVDCGDGKLASTRIDLLFRP